MFCNFKKIPNGNAFISGADLKFTFRAGQIEHSVVNGLPVLRLVFEGAVLSAGIMTRRCAPQTLYSTLRRDTASTTKKVKIIFE